MFSPRRIVAPLALAGLVSLYSLAHAAPTEERRMHILLYQDHEVAAVVTILRGQKVTVESKQVSESQKENILTRHVTGAVSLTLSGTGLATPVKMTAEEAVIEIVQPAATPPGAVSIPTQPAP